jgi:transposase
MVDLVDLLHQPSLAVAGKPGGVQDSGYVLSRNVRVGRQAVMGKRVHQRRSDHRIAGSPGVEDGIGQPACLIKVTAATGLRLYLLQLVFSGQARRQRGKSDTADAVAAALAALNGEASGVPKSRDGLVESIRALRVARAGAVKARTQAGNQLRDLILTAPEQVRRQLAGLPCQRQVDVAARFRLRDLAGPAEGAKAAMASLARRHQQLAAEIARLDAAPGELLTRAAPPEFLAKQGVATQVAATLLATAGDNPGRVRKEASFAALCGASPVDASSGKQLRHRLNRGGDRQANSALWTIAMTRLAHDPRTKAYAARRTAGGKTRKEIIRCLKRYIAREIYKILCRPKPPATASAPQVKQDLSAPVLT